MSSKPASRTGPRVSGFYAALLLAIVGIDLGVTWAFPDADPPQGYSRDHSLNIDGYWYLAEARAWALGHEPGVGDNYRLPLVSWPAYLIYSIGGVGIATSRVLSSVASVLTILLLATFLRRRFGREWALFGALFLALHPGWHAYVRSPVIYPWVSFWVLAAVVVGSGRGWWRWGAGVISMLVSAWLLKPIILAAAPALGYEGWRRMRHTSWGRGRGAIVVPAIAVAVVATVANPWMQPALWGKVAEYFSAGGLSAWDRAMSFEARSRVFSALPIALPLAWASFLMFLTHAAPTRGPSRSAERLMHLTVWGGLGFFAVFGYAPLRYLLIFFPFIIALAVSVLSTAAQLDRARVLPLRGPRGVAACGLGLVGTLYIIKQEILAASVSPLLATELGLVVAGVILIIGVGSPWLTTSVRRTAIPFLAFLLVPLAISPRLLPIIERPQFSLARASAALSSVVLPTARLIGPYAHTLTVENHMSADRLRSLAWGSGRLKERVESMKATHLVFDTPDDPQMFEAIFARDGVPLTLIDTFHIGGQSVLLYRLSTSQEELSSFEQGLECLAQGDALGAEARFFSVLRSDYRSGVTWTALGRMAMMRGDFENAYQCFIHAVEVDPYRIAAQVGLAALYNRSGRHREALHHLTQALACEPGHIGLRREVRQLRAIVEGSP